MMNRATRCLCAALSGFVASTSIAVIPLRAEVTPGKCYLFKPETAPPSGQHWAQSSEPATNRRCWVLRKIEAPSQAKASIPLPAPRAAARMTAATATQPTETAAINEPATATEWPAPPQVKHDGNGTAATEPAPPAPAPERAEQNLTAEQNPPNTAPPPAAELQPLAPRLPDAGLALLSRALVTPAPASQTTETKQETNPQPNVDAAEAPAAKSTEEPREIGAPNALQLLLLAIFCMPALYLVTAGAIRRRTEPLRQPYPSYASLDGAPVERVLLPPRLEPNENTVSS